MLHGCCAKITHALAAALKAYLLYCVILGSSSMPVSQCASQTRRAILRLQEGVHESDPESQPAALAGASQQPLGAKDTVEARDAMIVAIGIASVLIINVAYLGYITPPGGPDPYWADCFYGAFVAYFVLNGFALVFSVAALCAVTWGPFVLIWNEMSTWRTRVVNVGLAHLAISLVSLLGAFACAGFVTASVGAPELTCGNLRCTEGGVPCSASSLRDAWPYTYKLDPVLAKLNNATFAGLKGNGSGASTAGALGVDQDVVCRSYGHLVTCSSLTDAGKACGLMCAPLYTGNGTLDDADGRPIKTSCFVLVDKLAISNYWSEPNPYTFWCSLNGSGLGPGWLPLQWETAKLLLEHAGPEISSEYLNAYHNISSAGYAVEEQGTLSCPHVLGLEERATQILRPPREPDLRGFELLVNSFEGSGAAGSCMGFNTQSAHVYHYIQLLTGDYTNRHNCLFVLKGSGYPDSDRFRKGAPLNHGVRVGYYPSLQFQCSQVSDGVLCDYSVDPPLSVDAEGRFLDKKSLSRQSTAYVYVASLTTSSVEYAVIAMLAVAFVTIFGTLAGLGGRQVARKGLLYCKVFLLGQIHGHLVGAAGAAA